MVLESLKVLNTERLGLLAFAGIAAACAHDAQPAPDRIPTPIQVVAEEEASSDVDGVISAPPPHEAFDRAAEMDWARRQWPDELEGVELEPPRDRLLAWVKPGSDIKVWIKARQYDCQRAALVRKAKTGDSTQPETLGLVITQEKVVNGRRVRATRAGIIDVELRIDQHVHGVLSRVSDGVARFDGVRVAIEPYCPEQDLPCEGGGHRQCTTCSTLRLKVEQLDRPSLGVGPAGPTETCYDPCPPRIENPDTARVQRLFESGTPFRVSTDDALEKVAIYRSHARCQGDAQR